MTVNSPSLAVSVANAAGLPVLTIGDGLPINVLTVKVVNTSRQPLSLRGGTPAPDDSPDAAAASALSLYFGTLLTKPQYTAIAVRGSGWTARQLGAFPAWTIAPDADMMLAAGDSLTFTITGVNVSAAPSGHLTIDYANFGIAGNGLVRAPLDCRSEALTRAPISVSVFNPWIVSDGRNNTLVLQVQNSTSPLTSIGASWDTSAPPKFTLSFVYDEEDAFALTSAKLAEEITVAPSRWTPDPQPSTGDAPVWTLRPGTPPVLGADQDTLIETITVSNIVSFLPPGLARISLQWSHIPDYADGEAIAYFKKIAPIAITDLGCDPSWTLVGAPIHPIVRWNISGSPPTKLELVGPDGRHAVDVTDTSHEYPMALSQATTLTLHAEGPGGPADAHTSFDAVVFQTTLTVPLALDLPTPMAVRRSYRRDVIYVGCFEDLPEVSVGSVVITHETHIARFLVLDGTNLSQLAAIDAPWSAPQNAVGLWQSPPVADGIDRLAVVGDAEIQVWDIGENHSATKRATIPAPKSSQFLGFLPDGDLLIGALNPDPSEEVPTTFTVVRQDPLGSHPAMTVRVLPLDGMALRFVLTLDTEYLLSIVWKGVIEAKDDPRNETAVGPVVVRKTRISDGVHVDEVSLGQWYFVDMLLGVGLGAFPLVPARDGSAYLLFRVAMTGTGPTPLPFGNNVPELVQFPLDGSGKATSHTIPEVASASGSGAAAIGPQLSPNGNDLVIPAAGFLWIAPLSQPTAGVELKLGEPGTVEFSSGGDRLTLAVMDPNNQLAYSIVELNRTLVPPPPEDPQ